MVLSFLGTFFSSPIIHRPVAAQAGNSEPSAAHSGAGDKMKWWPVAPHGWGAQDL